MTAWHGRLETRFVILTNELPRLADASGAMANRFIILALTTSFFGKEDRGLAAKFAAEMPGLLNWSIEGWGRFRTNADILSLRNLPRPLNRASKTLAAQSVHSFVSAAKSPQVRTSNATNCSMGGELGAKTTIATASARSKCLAAILTPRFRTSQYPSRETKMANNAAIMRGSI